jgi:hypothetical protein
LFFLKEGSKRRKEIVERFDFWRVDAIALNDEKDLPIKKEHQPRVLVKENDAISSS